jgi:hypothetical protein
LIQVLSLNFEFLSQIPKYLFMKRSKKAWLFDLKVQKFSFIQILFQQP